MCKGKSSETAREAPIGSAEEGAMDSIRAKSKHRMEYGQGVRDAMSASELPYHGKTRQDDLDQVKSDGENRCGGCVIDRMHDPDRMQICATIGREEKAGIGKARNDG